MVADILLIAGAFGAGTYCIVLARRLNRFNDLEKGVGGAIAVLSAQVDDMTKTLEAARESTGASASSLGELTGRAEGVAQRLELLVASMHDLPEATGEPQKDESEPAEAEGTPETVAEEPDEEPQEVEDPAESAPEEGAGDWDEDALAERAPFRSTRTPGEAA